MSSFEQDLLTLCSAPDNNDDIKTLTSLLSLGTNPNIRNVELKGWTPLIIACTYNKCNIALHLLKHPQIKPQMTGNDGFDALYYAAKYCSNGSIITQLLIKGCNSNKCNIHGMTALFAAVANNQLQNVKALLLDPLLNVNQKNQYGGSAVHHCAYATDNVLIAECLIKHGANLFMKDHKQKMPIHVAVCYQRPKLYQFFRNTMQEQKHNWKCNISYDLPSKKRKYEENDIKIEEEDIKHIHSNSSSSKHYSNNIKHINNYSNGTHHSSYARKNIKQQSIDNKTTAPAIFSSPSSSVSKSKKEKRSRSLSPINFPSTPPLISILNRSNITQPQSSIVDHTQYIRVSHYDSNIHPQQRYSKQNQEFQQQMMTFVRKVENTIGIFGNKQVMNLLQEQQYLLSYEQQMLYEQCKYEYCKLEDKYKHTQLLLHQYQQELQNIIISTAATNINNNHSHQNNNNNNNEKRRSLRGQQFCEWFSTHINLMEYLHIFIDAGYDDIVCLPYLKNEQRLIQLGIKKPGHRLRICAAIEQYLLSAAVNGNGSVMGKDDGCSVAAEAVDDEVLVVGGCDYQKEGEKGTQ